MLRQNVYDVVASKPPRNCLSLPAGARIMKVSVYCKKNKALKIWDIPFSSVPPSVTSSVLSSRSLLLFHSHKREIQGITPGQILDFCLIAVCGIPFHSVSANSGSMNNFHPRAFGPTSARVAVGCSIDAHTQYITQFSKLVIAVILCVRLSL